MLDLNKVEASLEYHAKDPKWLQQAFCHKSYHKENPEFEHNEKLEFLGDAVIDVVVSDLLMQKYSEDQEGSLSRKRASIVNEERLFELAKKKEMDRYLLIGEREFKNNLHKNSRIIASVFEAVVGAIYKDSGFEVAYEWIESNFRQTIEEAFSEHDFEKDYKTRFQEWVQEEHKKTPRYVVINQTGPDHARLFEMEVFVGEESWGRASGSSKKSAAQNAAEQALRKIKK
jgi:ribonuclease-3